MIVNLPGRTTLVLALPCALALLFPVSAKAQNDKEKAAPAGIEFFEKKIRPVLVNSCQGCHNSKAKTAGLDLSSAEGFLHGGQSGPIVVEGNPEASRLIRAIGYNESQKMPPTGKLKDEEIADLTAWVLALYNRRP